MQPPESWRWAGPGWRERSRAELATGLVGVVIEAPDPRSCDALGRGAGRTSRTRRGGGFTLALERGTRVRLLPAPRGHEAALVAIEVAVRDRARFAAQAAAAGVLEADGAARIAGTRFVPV